MSGPDPSRLRQLSERARSDAAGSRELDVLVWEQIGWTHGGDDDLAWRRQLPRAPGRVVNGIPMSEAIRRFPTDMAGIARAWNVPPLSTSCDAAEFLLGEPEATFVWSASCDFGGLRRAHVFDGDSIVADADAATIPLALLAATLAASAARIESGLSLPDRS